MKKKRIIAAIAIVTIGAVLYFGGSKLVGQNRVVQPEEPSEPTVMATEKQINDVDHPATPAPKVTATPKPTNSPEASTKPSTASQKPITSQAPSTPTTATEPPVVSQKPNGDDSGSGDKPEVTPKPSQGQEQGEPPSYIGKNGEISPDGKYMYCQGFGWVERGVPGDNGGIGGQMTGGGEGGLSGNKVGNM